MPRCLLFVRFRRQSGGQQQPASCFLEREDCTLVPWYPFTHLAREGRMTVTIGRRELLAVLGGTAAAWPLAARAQQPAMPVVGLLNPQSPGSIPRFVDSFRRGLAETGYVEGRNVAIEYRWAEDRLDRLAELAADLVRHNVSVIAAPANAS